MNDDLRGRLEGHVDLLDQLGDSKVQGHILPATAKQIAQDIRDSLTEDATEAEQVVSECMRRSPFEVISVEQLKEEWCVIVPEMRTIGDWAKDIEKPTIQIEYIPPQWRKIHGGDGVHWS